MLSVTILSSVYAEELKDPRTRNETISNTILTATVNKRPDGMFEYIYDIESPITNKGIIRGFAIDLSCELDFGNVIFSDPIDPYSRKSLSVDGEHVPVQSYGVSGVTTTSRISVRNRISWGMYFKPGQIGKGIKLISPAPPDMRTYIITPSMQTDGYDYSGYDEDDPTLPWIENFTVTGSIKAPACSLNEIKKK